MKKEKQIIPIFMATDDNYAKYLAVALRSIIDNANKTDYFYRIYILETDLDIKFLDEFKAICSKYASVEYVNVKNQIKSFESKLTLRDYYTYTTYYRIFITEMFPEYDKAIYLDCDIVVNGDISRLYNFNLGKNLVGAIQEEVMFINEHFFRYAPLNLGVSTLKYFNAGVLVMNLKEFRNQDLYNRFIKLLMEKQFPVAQDQDYLNVLCKGKVRYLPYNWNKTPINVGIICNRPNLVHYKLGFKPWKYDNVMYGEYFYKYAKETMFYDEIIEARDNYTEEQKEKDRIHSEHLLNLIIEQNSKAKGIIGIEDGRIFENAARV